MRKAKVDDNQKEIVEALRLCGCSVAVTSNAHDGFPDLVVGYKGVNYMIEIKDGDKAPSKQKLTPAQVKFHESWRGQIAIVKNIDEALKLVGVA